MNIALANELPRKELERLMQAATALLVSINVTGYRPEVHDALIAAWVKEIQNGPQP